MAKEIRSVVILEYRYIIYVYMILVAFASVAMPLGTVHIKFDWLGAIMVCFAGLMWSLNGNKINRTVLVYVLVFTFWLVITSVVAALTAQDAFNFDGFMSYFLQFILAFLTFLIVSSMNFRTEVVRKLMVFWVVVGCAASLLAIIQVLSGDIIVDKFLYIPYYDNQAISRKVVAGVFAPTAWFSEASWFSSFLVVPSMFVFFEIVGARKASENRLFYYLAALLIAAGLFLSFSLTALISIFIGVFVMFLLSARSRLPILLIVLISLVLFFMFLDSDRVVLHLLRFTELFKNLFDFSAGSQYYGTTTSFYVRSVGIQEGLSLFLENPISGIGIGQGEIPFHSGFVTLLAEQGIFGAFLYYFPLIWIIPKLRQIIKCGDYMERYLATIFIIALVADYANGLVTHHPFHLQRWLLVSIVYGWVYSLRRLKFVDNALLKY